MQDPEEPHQRAEEYQPASRGEWAVFAIIVIVLLVFIGVLLLKDQLFPIYQGCPGICGDL